MPVNYAAPGEEIAEEAKEDERQERDEKKHRGRRHKGEREEPEGEREEERPRKKSDEVLSDLLQRVETMRKEKELREIEERRR